MENNIDIRWQQRFYNFKKALSRLRIYVSQKQLNELEQQGLIQAFEYTYELAWNVMRDYLEFSGNTTQIFGSRDAIRESFKTGLIGSGDMWMDMIQSRVKSSHTYDEETALEIVTAIKKHYITLFSELEMQLIKLSNNNV
jgi:nucleotidyltransferase substrate binding protein (TIGR01987 family)